MSRVKSVPVYRPETIDCPIDLSDNTNRFGAPPSLVDALASLKPDQLTRYPGGEDRALREALSDYIGAPPEWILTGCGSDDLLDSAFRSLAEPNEVLAYSEPTFSMIPLFARMNGLNPVGVPLKPDFDVDAEALLSKRPRIAYLCGPNNPTGTPVSPASFFRVLNECEGTVILDEAYAEFSARNFLSEIAAHKKLLVTRTFSKAFGLASLRVGYAVGHPDLLAAVEKARGPYKVNAVAERAATMVLRSDLEWMRTCAALAQDHRERFIHELKQKGFSPVPSSANFVLVPTADAQKAAASLKKRGIAVRAFPKLAGVGDALRISVGPWEQMAQVLSALCNEVSQ